MAKLLCYALSDRYAVSHITLYIQGLFLVVIKRRHIGIRKLICCFHFNRGRIQHNGNECFRVTVDSRCRRSFAVGLRIKEGFELFRVGNNRLCGVVRHLIYGFFFSLHLLGIFLFGKSFALLSCLSRGKIVCHCDYLSFTFLLLGFGCWCTVCAGAFLTSGFDTSGSLRSASFCCLDCALYRSSFAFTDGFLCLSLTVPLSVCISTGSESCLDGGFLSVLATVGFDWEYPSF